MKLSSIRTLLQFALDLEAMTSAFYETAITITTSEELKALFETLLIQGQARIHSLIEFQQQLSPSLLDEEGAPIESEEFRPKTECPPGCPDTKLLQLASAMEELVANYYSTVSNQIVYLEDFPDIFDQLEDSHFQIIKKLQTAG
ncbi:MAG: hypothetical protein ACFE89_06250 [Candidatus Hodarchaeota archaeon]